MTTPVVTVIMANYNGAAHMASAIASVQAQTLQAWELIVIDDASTDASVSIVKHAADQDPRIRLFVQTQNKGPGAARNVGLSEARGEWLAIFDSDDVLAAQRLERLVARATHNNALIVADNQMICASDLTPRQLYLSPVHAKAMQWVDLAAFVDSSRLYSPVPDLGFLKPLVSSSAVSRTGARYDENLRIGEDFHFMLQLLSAGIEVLIEPEPLYLYRKHSSSTSHRLSQETLLAILAADEAFLRRGDPLDAGALRAFQRRKEGLRSWIAYDRTIQAVRSGKLIEAISCAIRRPHAWRLMTEPLRVRWRRLVAQPTVSR